MSISTKLIVEGTVASLDSRTIKIKTGDRAGQDMTINSMIVVGQACMANVRIDPSAGQEIPKIGSSIRAAVEVSSYRDDDQVRLVAYI